MPKKDGKSDSQDAKPEAAKKDSKADVAKPAEKKDEPKKDLAKKDEPKSDAAKKRDGHHWRTYKSRFVRYPPEQD